MSGSASDNSAKKDCCPMHSKIVLGIKDILSEAECGVSDRVLIDYHDFGYTSEQGLPVAGAYQFRFCPWCGAKRDGSHPRRTTEVVKMLPTEEQEEGEAWKRGGQDEPE